MILQEIEMNKEKIVLKVHKAKITPPVNDNRYSTNVYKKDGKRTTIKANTYEGLIEKLFFFYYPDGAPGKKKPLRLHDIFYEWLEYKIAKKQNSAETKKQNISSYKKYVMDTEIDLMPLKDIRTIDLENWAIGILTAHKMTAKCFNTNKIVVTGTLLYAVRKGYIGKNPWIKDELEYSHLFKSERRRPSNEMIFYPDEIKLLCEEFESGYVQNGNIANLALKINFELELRVGELVALKWTDINFQNETVFIHRMENSDGNVVEYVKSDSGEGYRELSLTDEAIEIFKRIRRDRKIISTFVFCNQEGERTTKCQIEHRLQKAEKAIGWEKGGYKYSHCFRRTVASQMDAAGIPLDEIRRWLGHTNAATTLKYIYCPFRESDTKKRIKKNSILHTNNEYCKMCK